MNAKTLAILFWLTANLAHAQGFAGLGTQSDSFALPDQTTELDFPADHGPHPDFRIEWWYVTSNLTDSNGKSYGVQWTLFRSALAPREGEGWSSPQFWMGHAALTSQANHFVAETFARGGIGQAGVTAKPFKAHINGWQLAGPDFDNVNMTAKGTDFAYDLNLKASGPLIFHGTKGYSVKSASGNASHYYSQPYYEVTGTLTLADQEVEVSGTAWLDREWSSQPLSETQTGWDWFSLNLADGHKLMGFQLRDSKNPVYTAGTWITPDGQTTALPDGAFQAAPLNQSDPPTKWQVTLSTFGVDLEVEALNPHSFMTTSIPYWEGPVRISGSHEGQGYLEMTGYGND